MTAKYNLREAVDLLYSRGSAATTETYTPLLLDCFRHKDVHQAKRVQAHMERHMYEPTTTLFHNRLLHIYVQSGRLLEAQNLFEKMPRRDVFSYNAMLLAYMKRGISKKLWDFFNYMPFRDSVSYNTMISGLCLAGCEEKALGVFFRMLKERAKPTEYTYVSVLKACSKLEELRIGKVVHAKLVVGDFGGNVFVLNALIDFYANCGVIDTGRWLFDRITNKNLVSWNLIIIGHLKNGQPQKCIDLFHGMKASGLKPDQFTVSNVLVAFFRIGCVNEACKTFREIKEKDKVCWTRMIVGCAQNGLEEDALTLFAEMLSEKVTPDGVTISSVISSCGKLASLYNGQVVHSKAVYIGVDGDLLVSSALIDLYCKCGEPSDAWTVFNKMPVKNVVSWNSLIVGYAQNGRELKALNLYEKMLQENLKPSNISFVGVLTACIHAGLSDRGQEYFHSITKIHGMKPTLDNYTCMITLLGRKGDVAKALDLIKCMPYEPNCRIWSTLLSVCKMQGDIKHGKVAAMNLFKLDPKNGEPFILLSDMYATCRRWKNVAQMRSLLKSRNVKRISACSWIEIDGKVHKFKVDDKTHPEWKLIYRELDSLLRRLQEAGYRLDKKLALHNVGEDENIQSICYHSEKLALACALVRKPQAVAPIRIIKNFRVCTDCHSFMKFVSKVIRQSVIMRDSNRFHHFVGGQCSCNDYW